MNKFQFSGDSQLLLVGLADGEVHAYDSSGNFAVRILYNYWFDLKIDIWKFKTALYIGK